MDAIIDLRKEHHKIENWLIYIEDMLEKEKLDINKVRDIFGKIFSLLKIHEAKEDALFPKISEFNSDMRNSLNEINMIHTLINGHVKVLRDALNSEDISYIKVAMENDGRMFFSKLREHMHFEEKIFDSILFLKPIDFTHN